MEFSPHLNRLTQRDFQDPSPPRTAEQMYLRYSPMVGLKTGVVLLALLTAILSKVACRWAWKRLKRKLSMKRRQIRTSLDCWYLCCFCPRSHDGQSASKRGHYEIDDPLRMKQFPIGRIEAMAVPVAPTVVPPSCRLSALSRQLDSPPEDNVYLEEGKKSEPIAIICRNIDYSKDQGG